MATESIVVNRAKEYKFRCEFNGLTSYLVQEFDPGERKIGKTEHAGGGMNHPRTEGGFLKYEDAVLKMVLPVGGMDRSFWEDWMNEVQNPKTGQGLAPSAYYRNFSMYELDAEGNPFRVWEFYKAWPTTYKLGNRNSMSDNKDVIEEIHISYEWREQRVL